jgi:hypothetical protein
MSHTYVQNNLRVKPASSYRFDHRYPVGREISNSWHSLAIGFSFRAAATTNRTRCSRTSIVFQAISSVAPALAYRAPECKGCPGTLCKGCHETEHDFRALGQEGRRPVKKLAQRVPESREALLIVDHFRR